MPTSTTIRKKEPLSPYNRIVYSDDAGGDGIELGDLIPDPDDHFAELVDRLYIESLHGKLDKLLNRIKPQEAVKSDLAEYVDRNTDYYARVSVDTFQSSGTSAAELIVMQRENMLNDLISMRCWRPCCRILPYPERFRDLLPEQRWPCPGFFDGFSCQIQSFVIQCLTTRGYLFLWNC